MQLDVLQRLALAEVIVVSRSEQSRFVTPDNSLCNTTAAGTEQSE